MGQARSARFRGDGVLLFEGEGVWQEAVESQSMRGGWYQSVEGLGYHQEEAYWDAQIPTKTISEHLSVLDAESQTTVHVAKWIGQY